MGSGFWDRIEVSGEGKIMVIIWRKLVELNFYLVENEA